MGRIGSAEFIVLGVMLLLTAASVMIVMGVVTTAFGRKKGLVECRSCSKAISPRATACPQCGEPDPVIS